MVEIFTSTRSSNEEEANWLHFRTFCELVEGEENKLTTFSTWTIMLGCNESNIILQQHLCKLGQLRRKFTNIRSSNEEETNWPHFRTFCELVEGEENKLTTFSTWTIILGCNESNIIFQQHLCKLGQLWRSNGRNSQVLGQAMRRDQLATTRSIHTSRGEILHLLPAAGRGAVSFIRQLREREHCCSRS